MQQFDENEKQIVVLILFIDNHEHLYTTCLSITTEARMLYDWLVRLTAYHFIWTHIFICDIQFFKYDAAPELTFFNSVKTVAQTQVCISLCSMWFGALPIHLTKHYFCKY